MHIRSCCKKLKQFYKTVKCRTNFNSLVQHRKHFISYLLQIFGHKFYYHFTINSHRSYESILAQVSGIVRLVKIVKYRLQLLDIIFTIYMDTHPFSLTTKLPIRNRILIANYCKFDWLYKRKYLSIVAYCYHVFSHKYMCCNLCIMIYTI